MRGVLLWGIGIAIVSNHVDSVDWGKQLFCDQGLHLTFGGDKGLQRVDRDMDVMVCGYDFGRHREDPQPGQSWITAHKRNVSLTNMSEGPSLVS